LTLIDDKAMTRFRAGCIATSKSYVRGGEKCDKMVRRAQ
jgi:hypothetical protein